MQYLFTAVYTTNENDALDVHFPDLPGCRTQGKDMADATKKAEAILSLCLFDMEQHGKPIPTPQLIDEIALTDAQTASIVMASTDSYRTYFSVGTETCNVELPMWMSQVAKTANLDMAFMLQNCVRVQIGLPAFSEPLKIVEAPKPAEAPERIIAEAMPMPEPDPSPIVAAAPKPGKPEKPSAMELYSRQVRGDKAPSEKEPEREPAKDRHKPKYVARTVEYYPVDDIPVEDILSETPSYKPAETKGTKRVLDILLPVALLVLTVIGAYIILFTSIPENFRASITNRIQARQQRNESTHLINGEAHSSMVAAPTSRISARLQEEYGNSSMFARIGVLGTNIHEPVLYGVGSDFYHDHNLHRVPSPDGAVFMRAGEIGSGASPNNIVIYGGSPAAGGQFSDLTKFNDFDFFTENKTILLVTDHGSYMWEIFSFYIDTAMFDFDNRTSQSYNLTFAHKSMHGTDEAVSPSDRIITLITNINETSRYVLHARLITEADATAI